MFPHLHVYKDNVSECASTNLHNLDNGGVERRLELTRDTRILGNKFASVKNSSMYHKIAIPLLHVRDILIY
jgi:hypothetical protein